MASDIEIDIHDPPQELLTDQGYCRGDRCFFRQLRELMDVISYVRGIAFASFGHKNHIPFNVTGGLMVLAMRDFPGEIRDKEGGVADEPDRIIERLRWRKRLMPTLVSKHPEASAEQALDKSIHCPQQTSQENGRNVFGNEETVEEHEDRGKDREIAGNVRQAPKPRTLEAMGWNGITNLFDGDVRDLEVVAQSIDHTKVFVLRRKSCIESVDKIHLL